jgi:Na+-transporting methylmalonyl-CoA/oxaloacetate decarboxylase gamma subunit
MSGLFSSLFLGSGLTLAFSGLGGSGLFLAVLGLICGGLGLYLRKAEPPAPAQPSSKGKGDKNKKKNKKSKKNKKQGEAKPKKSNEGGSLLLGGGALTLLGVGMVVADLIRG